jgi:hypothetical protein
MYELAILYSQNGTALYIVLWDNSMEGKLYFDVTD